MILRVFINLCTKSIAICRTFNIIKNIAIATYYYVSITLHEKSKQIIYTSLKRKNKLFLSNINYNNQLYPKSFMVYSNFWNFLIIIFMKWEWVRTKKKFPIILTQELEKWMESFYDVKQRIIILFLINNIFFILIYFLMMAFSCRRCICLDICVNDYCKA